MGRQLPYWGRQLPYWGDLVILGVIAKGCNQVSAPKGAKTAKPFPNMAKLESNQSIKTTADGSEWKRMEANLRPAKIHTRPCQTTRRLINAVQNLLRFSDLVIDPE
jgi:hypothetical protein